MDNYTQLLETAAPPTFSSFLSSEKTIGKDIRQQLNEQLKCLDMRTDTQVSIVAEIQDFFRRRAELELEYSRSLEKLAKMLTLRHKQEKQKREQWHLFSTYSCWQDLIASTKRQSKDHAVLSELYSNNIINRLSQTMEDNQRMYKRCREIGAESHEELLKVLHELHAAMKTYHTYHGEMKQAEGKLRYVENQRGKLEQSIPKEKLEKSKKFRLIEKEIQKRQSKYNDTNLKAMKARNEYLLCMDAANAAIRKYFVDDLSDLVDCMDFGFHNCIARAFMLCVSADENIKKAQQHRIDNMNKCISSLDSRLDKQRFLEYNNTSFMMPKKFEFQVHKGDEITHFATEKTIFEEVEQRHKQLSTRLTALKIESEEIWKTLETAEKSLMEMINIKDYDCSPLFVDDDKTGGLAKQPEAVVMKLRADRQETEDFYLHKFREYTLGSNLIARLTAKHDLMRRSIGDKSAEKVSSSSRTSLNSQDSQLTLIKAKRKRIGRTPLVGQPKLFGGSLEEYLESTNQEIPLIMKSCIRIINLYGLHHQGIFRVSGSQVEISNFKEAFEREEDPLADMTDASDINSVAGVLKLYLRELREPLFPIYYFDQFMEISQLETKSEFVSKVHDLVTSLPRPVFIVMRYLFAFLNHLSEFSDENMMDPYNIAICFGPTLLPIPEDRDQVQYQNLVNELNKNIIIYQEEIFPNDGGITYEKYISTNIPDDNDVGEAPVEHISEDESDTGLLGEDADQARGERDITLQFFGKSEILEAVAQFDFSARSSRELSFKKGDMLTLYSQISSDWWKGSFDGVIGLIPDKYIMLKMRDEDRDKANSEESVKPRRTSSSSDSYYAVSSCDRTSFHKGGLCPKNLETPGPGKGGALTHSASASHINSIPESDLKSHKSPHSPSSGSLQHTPMHGREQISYLHPGEETPLTTVSVQTDDAPSVDLQRDLDSALAHVFSSLETLEKKNRTTQDTPDLVLDLPVNSSSPETGSFVAPDSPEFQTAAERFAQSNQCTIRKAGGHAVSGKSGGSSRGNLSEKESQSTSMKRSPSCNADTPISHPTKTKASIQVETIEIRSPGHVEKQNVGSMSKNVTEYSPSAPVSTFKPIVKTKPPVMKKPANNPHTLPSPDRVHQVLDPNVKQTSC